MSSPEEETPEHNEGAESSLPVAELAEILEQKEIAFVDERGIERRPNPEAPECFASPEIQAAVGEHFAQVDADIQEIRKQLEALTSPVIPEDSSFNPLTEELLHVVVQAAKDQLPQLTQTVVEYVDTEVTTGRLFKKTQIVPEPVEKRVKVEGYVPSTDMQRQQDNWRPFKNLISDGVGNLSDTDVEQLQDRAIKYIRDLLTSDKHESGESTGKKLPLLATKLRDSGLSTEEIDALNWAQIQELVPEVSEWLTDVSRLQEKFVQIDRQAKVRELATKLYTLSPQGCDTVAVLYYSDQQIQEIAELHQQIQALTQDGTQVTETEFLDQAHEAMLNFFTKAYAADSLLMHGTKFAPRVIASGALRPAGGMDPGEYTFATNRTGQTINGSNAVHWTGALAGGAFAGNVPHQQTEEILRRELEGRLGSTELAEAEIAKGGIGQAILAIRRGDLIKYSPYGGAPSVSSNDIAPSEGQGRRNGLIELTPAGWEKVAGLLQADDTYDLAFIAAPEQRPKEERYSYEYPLDELLIGVPEVEPEYVRGLLRQAGWTEEQIEQSTFAFGNDDSEGEALQSRVSRNPKYPNTVVAPISVDA